MKPEEAGDWRDNIRIRLFSGRSGVESCRHWLKPLSRALALGIAGVLTGHGPKYGPQTGGRYRRLPVLRLKSASAKPGSRPGGIGERRETGYSRAGCLDLRVTACNRLLVLVRHAFPVTC